MNADKLFIATWGLVVILAGVCAIVGLSFELAAIGIVSLWLLCVGLVLTIVGLLTLKKDQKTGTYQTIAGVLLFAVFTGAFAVITNLLDIYVTIALIIIIVGVGILTLALLRKR